MATVNKQQRYTWEWATRYVWFNLFPVERVFRNMHNHHTLAPSIKFSIGSVLEKWSISGPSGLMCAQCFTGDALCTMIAVAIIAPTLGPIINCLVCPMFLWIIVLVSPTGPARQLRARVLVTLIESERAYIFHQDTWLHVANGTCHFVVQTKRECTAMSVPNDEHHGIRDSVVGECSPLSAPIGSTLWSPW